MHSIFKSLRIACDIWVYVHLPIVRSGLTFVLLCSLISSERNILLAVDPEFRIPDLLAPYQPCKMRAVHTPLDPRLSYTDATRIMAQLAPKQVVCSELYTSPMRRTSSQLYGGAHDGAPILVLPANSHLNARVGEAVLSSHRSLLQAGLDPTFAEQLQPVVLESGGAVVPLQADLRTMDYRNELVASSDAAEKARMSKTPILLGTPRAALLVDVLTELGYPNAKVTRDGDAEVVSLPTHHATITLSTESTEIDVSGENDTALWAALRNAVMSLLTKVG